MRKLLFVLFLLLFLAGCVPPRPTGETAVPTDAPPIAPTIEATLPPVDEVAAILESLTMEEKVGQLFLARYDGTTALSHAAQYHLGGFILFSGAFRLETPASISNKISDLQASSSISLLMAVDEEGGTVTRISQHWLFRSERFPSPRTLYADGGSALLLETEAEKCLLLASLGLNVNMGPVCDITTDPQAFMYQRSLGQDPDTTGTLVAAMVDTMAQHHIGSVLKHFPGYGNNDDTHVGIARDSRPLEALEAADLVPFRMGIAADCDAILVSHTVVEALDADLPASLSPQVSYLPS